MDHSDKSNILNSSNQTKVDYRTATFDTKKLVSSGFVCSICLAVYEKFYSICPTCDSIVKVDFQKAADAWVFLAEYERTHNFKIPERTGWIIKKFNCC